MKKTIFFLFLVFCVSTQTVFAQFQASPADAKAPLALKQLALLDGFTLAVFKNVETQGTFFAKAMGKSYSNNGDTLIITFQGKDEENDLTAEFQF